MKIPVKCFEHLTNKGNGKKCTLAPLITGRHQDCAFKVNGMKESFTNEQKIKFVYALAKRCQEWHIRKKKINHYYQEIEPQIDTICSNISQKKEKVLLRT